MDKYELMSQLSDMLQQKSDLTQEVALLGRRQIQIGNLMHEKKKKIEQLNKNICYFRGEFENSLVRFRPMKSISANLIDEINLMEKQAEKELNKDKVSESESETPTEDPLDIPSEQDQGQNQKDLKEKSNNPTDRNYVESRYID